MRGRKGGKEGEGERESICERERERESEENKQTKEADRVKEGKNEISRNMKRCKAINRGTKK